MTPTRRRVIAGGASAVAAGLAGCLGGENDTEETVTDEIAADDIDRLSVETTNGEIRVHGEERDTVTLTARKQAQDEDTLDEVAVDIVQSGQTLNVVADDGGNSGLAALLEPDPVVDLELAVPLSLATVEADTTNGDIQCNNLESSISAETTNGDVATELNDAEDIQAETTNGDIEVSVPPTIEAKLSLETTNGALDVRRLDGYEVDSESSVETTLGAGTHEIDCETTNGDVTVQGRS